MWRVSTPPKPHTKTQQPTHPQPQKRAHLLRGDADRQVFRPLPDQLLELEHDALPLLHGRVAPGGEGPLGGGHSGAELFGRNALGGNLV